MSVWADILHTVTYGGVELDVLTAVDSLRWAIARYTYARKDGADLDPMGAEPRSTRCKVLFFERRPLEGEVDGGLNHVERFELFYQAAATQVPLDFVHPLTGTYRALVEDLDISVDASEDDAVEVDCTFVEDSTSPAVFDISGRPVRAGVAQVEVEAELLNAQLAEVGLVSTVGDDAASTVSGWESNTLITARQVNLELQSLSSSIADAVDELELTTQLDRYPVWRSMQRLHYEVRRAAEAFRQTQPTIFEFVVQSAIPLRVLAGDMYGAEQAESRYQEMLRLNDIDDPSLLAIGMRLRANAPDSQPRAGLRSAR